MPRYQGNRYIEEARLFYVYLVTEKCQPEERIHVLSLKEYHAEWWLTECTAHPNCRRWRPIHETMKRHKALKKSGKGGYFRLGREWPTGSSIVGGLRNDRLQDNRQSYGEPAHTTAEEASVTQSVLHRFRQNK